MEKQRVKEIDFLRGGAAFLVVLGHAIIVYPVNLQNVFWCKLLYDSIYSFHMALFFGISGYCYSPKEDYKSYIKNKFMRLGLPYMFFAFIGIIPRVLFPNLVNRNETIVKQVISNILDGGEYWFLYTLMIVFIIFPFIEKIMFINKKNLCFVLLAIFSIGQMSMIAPKIFCTNYVIYYLLFFALGNICKRYQFIKWFKNKLLKINSVLKITLCIASFAYAIGCGAIMENNMLCLVVYIKALMGIVACVILTILLPNVFEKFERYSKYSLGLYLLNGYCLVISRFIICNVIGADNPAIIILFNMIVDFYLSYIFLHYIISKIPIIRNLVGVC